MHRHSGAPASGCRTESARKMKGVEDWPSVGALAAPLVESLIQDAARLAIGVGPGPSGATLVDAGIDHRGGIEAGLRIAEICMAGLGRVRLGDKSVFLHRSRMLGVSAANPVLACLGSQYAGWSLAIGDGEGAYNALGSGPARALAAKEELFAELGYRDRCDSACLVLEVERPPPDALIEKIATDCAVAPENLTLILTPTRSIPGTVQVVARSLEVALHKAHYLGFPLDRIAEGEGSAPLPPPASSFVEAMGRANDAILYGGRVRISVRGDDADAEKLAADLPSSASRDYGKPFAEIFAEYDGDFFAIDPLLFSPAEVTVTAIESGREFDAGAVDPALVEMSFGGANE